MWRILRVFTVVLVCLLGLFKWPITNAHELTNTTQISEASIVKVYVSSKSSSMYSPWNSNATTSTGSGFVIEGQRIITNAHVVADHIFIEIQRNGNPKRYSAHVASISHELDIAVLTLDDERFFQNSQPLPLGQLPAIHQEVLVYGYPIGGDTLSTTRGIVSRIEYLPYAHSGLSYEMIQIDAAINAGNSGGPAIADGKVIGVVMQKAEGDGENIGYIIPTAMLERLLLDLQDGQYNGFPAFSAQIEPLLNPTLKKKYQLTEQQTGVLVTRVCANTGAETVLKAGDVLTHIDGQHIDDDGTSPLNDNNTIYFLHYVDLHQVAERITLAIVRQGKSLTVELPLTEIDHSSYIYDQDPRYFIYGGFVFVANNLPDSCFSREEYDQNQTHQKQDDVTIAQVLSTSDNIGYHDISSMSIDKINGKRFNSFADFYRQLRQTPGAFVELEDSNGYEIAIDRQLAEQQHQQLMEQYRIQQDHSAEIDEWNKQLGLSPINLKQEASVIR